MSPCVIIVMGVAGCGKTTIGALLAEKLGWQFSDADEFHPAANVAKMSAGQPLNDDDRTPWLQGIRDHITDCLSRDEGAVVTCSALKKVYRDVIRVDPARVKFVHLHGSRELLWERISGREGHFMKPAMLDSQLATLEIPEDALKVDITPDPDAIVATIRDSLSL
ncbi:MAG: gluconate kinase [Opitutaceae bacterium]|nr:gluconate kinase [Opitutaceae bacterium]|tara:strand:- start:1574 stop:2068 length:495 start_codon:yes stop_codon:yes gene_type:complete